MSIRRLAGMHDACVRDLMRDYCSVFLWIAEQNERYHDDSTVSYAGLNDLIGEADSKGVFWRLKDMSHYLFRRPSSSDVLEETPEDDAANVGALVDWCIGYAFHECGKLREDAFQGQHYAARLAQLRSRSEFAAALASPLEPFTGQTSESCRRELSRILNVLRSGMRLLVRYMPQASENCVLARWLLTENQKVRHAFGDLYESLIVSLYGENPERMHSLAAKDFIACGRIEQAREVLEAAAGGIGLDSEGKSLFACLE